MRQHDIFRKLTQFHSDKNAFYALHFSVYAEFFFINIYARRCVVVQNLIGTHFLIKSAGILVSIFADRQFKANNIIFALAYILFPLTGRNNIVRRTHIFGYVTGLSGKTKCRKSFNCCHHFISFKFYTDSIIQQYVLIFKFFFKIRFSFR